MARLVFSAPPRCPQSVRFIVALLVTQSGLPLFTPRCTPWSMAQSSTLLIHPGTPTPGFPINTPVTDKVALAQAVATAIAWEKQEDLCLTLVHLKVTDATLEEILAELRLRVPSLKSVEVRLSNPARFSLDLPHATVGKILQATAALMGGNLYVFTDHLLIAGPKQVGEDERAALKEWVSNAAAGSIDGAERNRAKNGIVDYLAAVMGKPGGEKPDGGPQLPPVPGAGGPELPVAPLKILTARYGDLAPSDQALVQQLIKWPAKTAPNHNEPATLFVPQHDTLLTLSYDAFYSRLEIENKTKPNSYVWDSGLSPEIRQQILKYRAGHPDYFRAGQPNYVAH